MARKNIHFMQNGKEKYLFYAGWQGKIFILCRMARKNIYFMQNGKEKYLFYAEWQGKIFIFCRMARKHINFQVGCQGRILMLTLGGQEKLIF